MRRLFGEPWRGNSGTFEKNGEWVLPPRRRTGVQPGGEPDSGQGRKLHNINIL